MKGAGLCAWIRSPAKRGINHDLSSNPGTAIIVASGRDFAGCIRPEDCRKADTSVLAAADPDIPMVERGCAHADHNLAWTGDGHRPFLGTKVAWTTELT
jgi:hypothetical protein